MFFEFELSLCVPRTPLLRFSGASSFALSFLLVSCSSDIDSTFSYEPEGGLYDVGDTAEFGCQVPDGKPTPKVRMATTTAVDE